MQEVCVKKLIFICAAVALAGCADSSMSPDGHRAATRARSNDELTCRSGYVIAYDEFGNPYCVPADGLANPSDSTSTSAASTPQTQTATRRW
jgi:hypothetical protein